MHPGGAVPCRRREHCHGHNGVAALLEAILTDQPKLDGANCAGRHPAFDPIEGNGHLVERQEQIRVANAAQTCAGCSARSRCPCPTVTDSTTALVVSMRRRSASHPALGMAGSTPTTVLVRGHYLGV